MAHKIDRKPTIRAGGKLGTPVVDRRCPLCGRLPLRVLAVPIGAACKLIGIGKTSWYRLQALGLSPAVSRRKGARPLVRVTELEAWLRRGEGGDDDC